MQVVILAAGLGQRMRESTQTPTPKPMTQVGAKILLAHSLRFASLFKPTSLKLVAGYKKELIKKYVSEVQKSFLFPIQIVENDQYLKGNIYSLRAALTFLDDDFLLMNVDHIYQKKIASLVKKNIKSKKNLTVVCDADRVLVADDMKILSKNGILNKISKTLTEYDFGYIGLTYCPKECLASYKKYIEKAIQIYGEKTNVESILQAMAADGLTIEVCDVSHIGWVEVNTLQDINNSKEKIASYKL